MIKKITRLELQNSSNAQIIWCDSKQNTNMIAMPGKTTINDTGELVMRQVVH